LAPAGQENRARLARFALAWAVRFVAVIVAAAIWAGILSQNGVGRTLFLEIWAALSWLLTSVIVGLACGSYLASAVWLRTGMRRLLWPVRILVIVLLASYAVGLFIPPTGAGVANPGAYPFVLAIGAAVGFVRAMLASGRRRRNPPPKR
jgi:hypothetical protein